jgi:hypothetical protein
MSANKLRIYHPATLMGLQEYGQNTQIKYEVEGIHCAYRSAIAVGLVIGGAPTAAKANNETAPET